MRRALRAIVFVSIASTLAGFVEEIAFLYEGRIIYRGPAATIADAPDPLVRQFVRGELEGPLADLRQADAEVDR